MSEHSASSVYWHSTKDAHLAHPLSGDVKTTVAIIGGGVAGLSCAQRLHDAGVPVVLIEKEFCGSGASGKTSGFITPDSEIELSSLLNTYGAEKAKRIWEFVLSGVRLIRENIRSHAIDCDLKEQDSLFVATSAAGFRHVTTEHEARVQLGYTSTLYSQETIRPVIGSQRFDGAVRYPETFGMNSYAYCLGMRDALRQAGVVMYENTAVERIEENVITTPHGTVTAEQIILCADRSIPDMGFLTNEIYHVQTFLGVTAPLTEQQVTALFPEQQMMVWDTSLIYNYFRITGERRLLIGGGDLRYTYAHHLSSSTDRFRQRLEQYIHTVFPALDIHLEYLWPGMLGVSKDLLPIMGIDPRNPAVWCVGAATGLPWAAALGHYAADRILSNRNEFDADFSPQRRFVIGSRVQALLTTPVTYALSHGIAKYI